MFRTKGKVASFAPGEQSPIPLFVIFPEQSAARGRPRHRSPYPFGSYDVDSEQQGLFRHRRMPATLLSENLQLTATSRERGPCRDISTHVPDIRDYSSRMVVSAHTGGGVR